MYDRVKEAKKKNGKKWSAPTNGLLYGRERKSFFMHYQIMICIFTAGMNNNKRNVGKLCGTQASGCHGDVAVPRLLPVKMQNMSRAQQRCEKLTD